MDGLKKQTVYKDLYPMLVKSERLELDKARSEVKDFLANSVVLTPKHKEYLHRFAAGVYKPDLLFSGELLENIEQHQWQFGKL